MKYQEIPYVKLTSSERKTALEILDLGVTLLKKWSSFFPPKSFRSFRNAVMNFNLNSSCNTLEIDRIPKKERTSFLCDIPVIQAIRSPNSKLGGRSVEQALLESLSGMAKKHAKKWSKNNNTERYQDLLQESYLQIVESLYSWQSCYKVSVTTFVWVSLTNRMSNVSNQQNMFCPLTNADLKLRIEYEKVKGQMNSHSTFEQIAEKMGLDNEQKLNLTCILKGVVSENQLEEEQEDFIGDYTTLRVDHTKSEAEISFEDIYVQEVLLKSGLDTMELELIKLAMNPYNGWQTDYAETHINPKTNKPYSRMRITQVLADARLKVAMVLDQKELCAA